MATVSEAYELALKEYQAGRAAQAEPYVAAILQAVPDLPEALQLMAMIRHAQGRAAEGVPFLERAIAGRRSPSMLANLGALLSAAGRLPEALSAINEALAADPSNGPWHFNRGVILQGLGQQVEAEAAFTAAGEAGMDSGWGALARLRIQRQRPEAAIDPCERYLASRPNDVAALSMLGMALGRSGRRAEALAVHRRALEQDPSSVENAVLALDVTRGVFDFEGQARDQEALVQALRQSNANVDWRLLSSVLYRHLYRRLPRDARRLAQSRFDALIAADVGKYGSRDTSPTIRTGRTRIGYLSANLKNHPIGQVALSVLGAHDRDKFEVHGYFRGGSPEGDPYAARHRAQFEHVHEAAGLNPGATADLIRRHGIDVLVYLDGHMDKEGLEVMALRPAPVRVFWLGHAEGLGRQCADYLIADRIVVPDEDLDDYDEAVVRVPGCYHCADAHPVSPALQDRRSFGLPEEGTVFCAFNAADKIDASVFETWCMILRAVPGSVLWLSRQASIPEQADGLRREASMRGIDPARLIFAERVADKAAHLARHRLADLFLDTWTMTASTTALDALLAGLPMVTRRGDSFPGRISTSMLTALGMGDWVEPTVAQYVETAVKLVSDPERLRSRRQRLLAAVAESPLFQAAPMARKLEAVYSACLARHRAGLPAASFDID